ncbi:ABC-type sugar transport system [Cutibacterium acnes JCM 18920]|nr:ABC-type sugar transport system [Cutibacterium acnes JCM 18920]
MLVVMTIAALYFLAPLWWFLVSATKSNGGLYSGNPFWFHDFSLAENFTDIVHRDGGIYFRWLRNSVFYSLVAGVGAGLISAMAGYALAKYRFRGREAVFNCVLAATLLPIMLLTVPYVLEGRSGGHDLGDDPAQSHQPFRHLPVPCVLGNRTHRGARSSSSGWHE